MLGSWVTPILRERGIHYPFANSTDYLENSDVTIANLEAPFTDDGEPFEKQFNFKVPPEYARGVKASGIDVLTLANNHIMDYGETGLISTIQTLDEVGLLYSGAGRNITEAHQPALLEVRGKRVAFFGYSMTFPKEFYAREDTSGTAYPEPELMEANLASWEDSVDFTVVSFHWGAEKVDTPKDYQVYFAHLAVDSGADLVLGHHPHVLQGIELYKNRLIAYSLGNFAFGSYSKHAVDSIILKVHINAEGLLYAHCIPINVDNREIEFQPTVVDGDRKNRIISRLQELSLPLNHERNIIGRTGLIMGEWKTLYEDWLLDTVMNYFWRIGVEQDSN